MSVQALKHGNNDEKNVGANPVVSVTRLVEASE